MASEEVVIVGAGIKLTGLAIAHRLRRSRPSLKLSIVARDLPCDDPYSQLFASVWAGADWSAFAPGGSREAKWERQTYEDWITRTHSKEIPPEILALVDVEKHVEKDQQGLWSNPWWKDTVLDFKVQPGRAEDPGVLHYKSFCLDAPAYLLLLFRTLVNLKTLTSSDGLVKVHRMEVPTLHSIKDIYPNAKVVINASEDWLPAGVEPRIFTGVNSFSSTVAKEARQDTYHELSYIIPRARSGLVILGGSYEPDRIEKEEDTKQTARILRDSATLWPALIPSWSDLDGESKGHRKEWDKIKVLKVNVGFRPKRIAGPRIEIDGGGGGGIAILHAYGLGGAGYQRSVGVALEVDEALDQVLDTPQHFM
ncbi:hypothetical protein CBS101457_003112 [Exobasidium rhododendri]|nr:hypothetical protein CBS101457_003112 [Exobasidium rhododendri]